MADTNFIDALARIFPADRLLTRPGELIPFESDGLTMFRAQPLAVVIPQTQDEVVAAVRLCHEMRVPFVARGSGTSLSGGSLPIEHGLVITLNRMDKILSLDPDQRLAVVEPGAVNLHISHAAAPHGLYYSPDPSSQQICTIGGNVAFNSGGAHCLRHGMTSNHVIAIKAVMADGEVVELGSSSLDQTGPDEVGLFVGSEGLFGIALEITLRLLPKPECLHTVLAGYETLEQAGNAVAQIVASGLLPGAMEIMDALAIQAAEAAVSAGYPEGASAVMIVELEGTAEEIESQKARLDGLVADSGAMEVRVAQDADQRAAIWRGRKSAFSAVGRLSPDFIVQDGVVPRNRLGEALARIDKLSAARGLRVANVFHAGDGNLHPLILFNGSEKGALEKAEDLAGEILDMCIEMGGSITGEHGIGLEKRDHMPGMFTPHDLDTLKRIRNEMDPGYIANPGKMFPDSQAPSLTQVGLHPLEKQGIISRE